MVANKGRKAFEGALGDALKGKVDKPIVHPGLMGAYLDDGRKVVTVPNRQDYVWVRIRGATSEPIQAFNDTVGRHFDLPVLVARDENNPIRWKVIARDVGAYDDWGGGGYLPKHGLDHSFAGIPNSGADIAWIYKRQFMPLLPRPSSTGSKSIYVEAGYYFANGKYNWWPGSGSADFDSFQPTGAYNSKFVTVYIDPDDGILQYTAGPEFNAYEPSGTFTNFIALPESEQGIPVAAVFLTSGTQWINWSEIYDLRLAPISTEGTGTFITVLDDGQLLGTANTLNFSGPGFVTTISGSYAEIASNDWVEVAGDTMTGPLIINTNSAAALVVEQSGVNDDTLVVDTAAGRTGFGTPTPVSLAEFSDSSVNMDGGLTLAAGGITAKTTFQGIAVGSEVLAFFGSNLYVDGALLTQRFNTAQLGWAFVLDNRASQDLFKLEHFSSGGILSRPLLVLSDGSFAFGDLTVPPALTGGKFVMDGSGKFGFGTDTPGFFVDIQDADNPALVITDLTNTVQAKIQSFDTTAAMGTRSNHQFNIVSNNISRIWVGASGTVGIGESPPINSTLLTIKDGLTFKESTEPTADADYGKMWTESDNVLYFQDGDGVKHAIGGTPAFRSYSATTQGLGANPDIFVAGFYEWSAADFNFTQAGTSGTFGTANISYAAHAFVVAAAAGTTDGSDLVLTVTGTSIDDQGNRVASDSEVIVADATAAATDQYFETTKKWLGQITFTLTSTGGATFSFDFNYGLAKYDDWGNRDFTLTDIEFVAFAGASDTNFDVKLMHHRTTGWTYSAGAFTPITATNTIASMAGDHSTDDQLNNSQHASWKRDDLSTSIDGTGSDGFLILISSSANNAVEYINAHVGVLLH